MPTQAPVTHHLDLYAYWVTKRGSRVMPARSDIDPADITALLPFLMIVEKAGERFRYRLVGTAVTREYGHDATSGFVGAYLNDPGSAAAAQAIFERAFTTGHPVFGTGQYKIVSGPIHHLSLLILPLSDAGTDVNMSISCVIARFGFAVTPHNDWLKGARVKVRDVVNVDCAAELKERCLEWEQYCSNRVDRARPRNRRLARWISSWRA